MTDELIKTLILAVPNFIGFVVLSYILVKYVIVPLTTMLTRKDEIILDLALRLSDCDETSHPPAPPSFPPD